MNPDFSFAVLLSDMLTIVDSFMHFVISTKHAFVSVFIHYDTAAVEFKYTQCKQCWFVVFIANHHEIIHNTT
jgi:ribosomal protein S27AE